MFNNKVVVVTGAGSGIGREIAIQLAAAGARLALSDINRAAVDETLAKIAAKDSATEVRAYTLDVSSREAVMDHAAEVKRDFFAVHYVINNAGATVFGTVNHTSIEEYEWQLGINMWGVLYGTKAFLPMMLEQREGCIVNISSVFGLLGFPTQSAYNMSKFAVRGLTEALWSELEGTGVRAVCVHPGAIKTNIDKAGRICAAATAEDRVFADRADQMLHTPPAECAADIIQGLLRGKKRILAGKHSTAMFLMSRFLPNSYPRLLGKLI